MSSKCIVTLDKFAYQELNLKCLNLTLEDSKLEGWNAYDFSQEREEH